MTKHDSKTANELILENAPEGATHVEIESSGDFEYWRLKGGLFEWHHFCPTSQDYIYSFQKVDSESMEDYHSLTDIKELVELRKKNAELNTAYETVTQTRCVSYEDLAIRDLEQQAKGVVKGYVSACKWALGSQYDESVAKNRALIYAKKLKEQG